MAVRHCSLPDNTIMTDKKLQSDEPRITRKVITRDGSATRFSEACQQHYHNVLGALTESRHVFFKQTGLFRALAEHRNLTICETGFGTGFHLLLTELLRRETGSGSRIRFYSVEKYPLNGAAIREMGYEHLFAGSDKPDDSFHDLVHKIADFSDILCSAGPNQTRNLSLAPLTEAYVFHGDFFQWDLEQITRPVDFFLHDAFSPSVNPELWSRQAFARLIAKADPQSVLGTYCSATEARAAMVLAGWHVARAAGPPGKREMTLASPCETVLAGFKRVNEQRLKKRFQNEL